ncbi:hypothetical protein GCM10009526_20120 [Glutamicibacter creatinolyticus]
MYPAAVTRYNAGASRASFMDSDPLTSAITASASSSQRFIPVPPCGVRVPWPARCAPHRFASSFEPTKPVGGAARCRSRPRAPRLFDVSRLPPPGGRGAPGGRLIGKSRVHWVNLRHEFSIVFDHCSR